MRAWLLAAAFACAAPISAQAQSGFVFGGMLDLASHQNTGSIDGCRKVQKGLIMGGGFMMFTCEKLLSHLPISDHKPAYTGFQETFKNSGWTKTKSDEPAPNKVSFTKTDSFGCKIVIDMELWTDRSMWEPSAGKARDNHRQIVFKAWFRGSACDVHYPQAESLAYASN